LDASGGAVLIRAAGVNKRLRLTGLI